MDGASTGHQVSALHCSVAVGCRPVVLAGDRTAGAVAVPGWVAGRSAAEVHSIVEACMKVSAGPAVVRDGSDEVVPVAAEAALAAAGAAAETAVHWAVDLADMAWARGGGPWAMGTVLDGAATARGEAAPHTNVKDREEDLGALVVPAVEPEPSALGHTSLLEAAARMGFVSPPSDLHSNCYLQL
jgi:hypothetical protein